MAYSKKELRLLWLGPIYFNFACRVLSSSIARLLSRHASFHRSGASRQSTLRSSRRAARSDARRPT